MLALTSVLMSDPSSDHQQLEERLWEIYSANYLGNQSVDLRLVGMWVVLWELH